MTSPGRAGHQPDLGAAVAGRRCPRAGRADAGEPVPWHAVAGTKSRGFGHIYGNYMAYIENVADIYIHINNAYTCVNID